MSGNSKRIISVIRMVLSMAALTGCVTHAADDSSVAQASAALTATRWELVNWSGHEIPHGDNGEPVILTFQGGEQASVSGRAWCNRFSAPYVLRDNERLTIGHAAATRMACVGQAMEFESAFLDKLQALERFRIRGDTLELLAVDGEVMRLQARSK